MQTLEGRPHFHFGNQKIGLLTAHQVLECGEAAEGLTFERFRQKLESNKATLVGKYGCRTVRFQVYVKEGKAALKATPVR